MRPRSRRRQLSMTSLIDVIFLLLLFFMLSSTFTRFSEVTLSTGGTGAAAAQTPPIFVQLGPERLRINGTEVALDSVTDAVEALGVTAETPETPVLLALSDGVTAQRLTDTLGAFRGVAGITLTVLGGA